MAKIKADAPKDVTPPTPVKQYIHVICGKPVRVDGFCPTCQMQPPKHLIAEVV